MTREELRDYVEEQRSLNNIPYHIYSELIDGIDTLEQEPILDKIRAEIESYKLSEDELSDMDEDSVKWGMKIACDIVDSYRAERSEDKK